MINGCTGIEFLTVMQDFRLSLPGFVTTFFEDISSPLFYLVTPVILSVIFYWFIDKRAGDRIAVNTLCAYNLVNFFKFIIRQPRPWVLDPSIQPTEASLKSAPGYSFPSGHSTVATASYLSATLSTKMKFFKVLFITIMVLIVFARLFLCVHTPLDVLFGVLIAIIAIIINEKVLDYGDKDDRTYYIVSLFYIVAFSAIFITIMLTIDTDYSKSMAGMGLFYGIFIGRVLDRGYIKYSIPQLKLSKKVIFTLIGLLGFAIFTGVPFALKLTWVCVIGGMITGVWLFAVCPMIITKYK